MTFFFLCECRESFTFGDISRFCIAHSRVSLHEIYIKNWQVSLNCFNQIALFYFSLLHKNYLMNGSAIWLRASFHILCCSFFAIIIGDCFFFFLWKLINWWSHNHSYIFLKSAKLANTFDRRWFWQNSIRKSRCLVAATSFAAICKLVPSLLNTIKLSFLFGIFISDENISCAYKVKGKSFANDEKKQKSLIFLIDHRCFYVNLNDSQNKQRA